MSGVSVSGLRSVVSTRVPLTSCTSRSYSTANTIVNTAAGIDACRTAAWRAAPDSPRLHASGMAINGDATSWQAMAVGDVGMYAGTLGDVGSDGDLDIVGPRSYWTGPTDLYENMLVK